MPDPLLPQPTEVGGWRSWLSRLDDLADRLGVGRRRLITWLGGLAAVVCGVAALLIMNGRHGAAVALDLPRAGVEPSVVASKTATGSAAGGVAGTGSTSGADVASSAASSSSPPPSSSGPMVVDVAGAVARPGIYRLPPGSRVADAVAAAGGPTGDADIDQVNLAELVADAEQVRVPRPGDPPPAPSARSSSPSGSATTAPAIVNLNTATADQLDTLPRVGPATAAAIIQWRTQHGSFKAVDDLLDVSGIGPAKLEQLRPFVRV